MTRDEFGVDAENKVLRKPRRHADSKTGAVMERQRRGEFFMQLCVCSTCCARNRDRTIHIKAYVDSPGCGTIDYNCVATEQEVMLSVRKASAKNRIIGSRSHEFSEGRSEEGWIIDMQPYLTLTLF